MTAPRPTVTALLQAERREAERHGDRQRVDQLTHVLLTLTVNGDEA